MRTPAKGAASTTWVATAPELELQTDKLWSIKKPLGRPVKGWNDDAASQQLAALIDGFVAKAAQQQA